MYHLLPKLQLPDSFEGPRSSRSHGHVLLAQWLQHHSRFHVSANQAIQPHSRWVQLVAFLHLDCISAALAWLKLFSESSCTGEGLVALVPAGWTCPRSKCVASCSNKMPRQQPIVPHRGWKQVLAKSAVQSHHLHSGEAQAKQPETVWDHQATTCFEFLVPSVNKHERCRTLCMMQLSHSQYTTAAASGDQPTRPVATSRDSQSLAGLILDVGNLTALARRICQMKHGPRMS